MRSWFRRKQPLDTTNLSVSMGAFALGSVEPEALQRIVVESTVDAMKSLIPEVQEKLDVTVEPGSF